MREKPSITQRGVAGSFKLNMEKRNWFEVSVKGLAELQTGKPKHYIVRELVQNAWDEDITECKVDIQRHKHPTIITVFDDSPEGFKDLTDAYTVFKTTPKRANPKQRGRFNLGEKQAIALAKHTTIETTKGTITFDKNGRHHSKKKREFGSQVSLEVKMTKTEYESCVEMAKRYLPPKGIKYVVNGEIVSYTKPRQTISVSLETEILQESIKRVQRKTEVEIPIEENSYLYEMGIPICPIDCKYSINVQQKIPLSVDRETVPQRYLKVLFAEVLNATSQDIGEGEASDNWVRQATASKRVSGEAVKNVVQRRFGDKVVVANPFDKTSIDDALAHGYKVVRGSELSKEEWENVKGANAIQSSSEVFGHRFVNSKPVEANREMIWTAELAKRVAKECLGIEIAVHFARWEGKTGAQYGDRTLTFNVKSLGRKFFKNHFDENILDLIIHELGHEKGMHTETTYHKALTQIGSQLVVIALQNPKFFR